MESAAQVVCGFSIYTSLTPFTLFGVRFGCRLVEDGNEDDDDVDDGNVAAADDDGFSFDIAQSEALASPHTHTCRHLSNEKQRREPH